MCEKTMYYIILMNNIYIYVDFAHFGQSTLRVKKIILYTTVNIIHIKNTVNYMKEHINKT